MTKKRFILGIRLDSTSKSQVLKFVASKLAKKGQKFSIVTPNPEIIVEAQNNKKLFEALNSSTLSIPDGIGLKIFGHWDLKIIKGRELMTTLFALGQKQKLKVFLLGSHKKTIDKSLGLLSKYKYVIARGVSGPRLDKTARPISARQAELEREVIKTINNFRPDVLFVAFGAPKQELWVKNHLPNLNVGGAMVVGGALDVFAGTKRPPPKILASLGFEWLWRLIQEPKRIGRIWRAVVVFPFLVLKNVIIPNQ